MTEEREIKEMIINLESTLKIHESISSLYQMSLRTLTNQISHIKTKFDGNNTNSPYDRLGDSN